MLERCCSGGGFWPDVEIPGLEAEEIISRCPKVAYECPEATLMTMMNACRSKAQKERSRSEVILAVSLDPLVSVNMSFYLIIDSSYEPEMQVRRLLPPFLPTHRPLRSLT